MCIRCAACEGSDPDPSPGAAFRVTGGEALAALRAAGDSGKAAKDAAYHRTDRETWGVPGDVLAEMTTAWRRAWPIETRLAVAGALWDDGAHDARIAAPKLLAQARIPEDGAVWDLLVTWVPAFDGWAIADVACGALARRLVASPARLDVVEGWTGSDHLWTKRAALVATLPWTKRRHPSEAERAARERVLGWAAGYVADERWFVQKAVAWWLRDLSRRDPARVRAFLDVEGAGMAPFARREARRLLPG